MKLERWNSRLISLVVLPVLLLGACECGERSGEGDESGDAAPVADREDDTSEPEERIEETFGLPMPPDHDVIRRQDLLVRISTDRTLDELEEFFGEHVVDAEIVRTGGELRIVPLRPHSPVAEASHRFGPDSPVVVNYRQPASAEGRSLGRPPIEEADGDDSETETDDGSESDDGEDAVARADTDDSIPENIGEIGADSGTSDSDFELRDLGGRPDWLEDVKGKPVEITTEDGEKLAPGAKWGEPYTPPEGSPLHKERFRHNFGRPFGDWR